ncbi:MAG: thiamine-phosphate kinase [Gammaproteobacteria bacterium]|nr:thiamine-phosphate kinase [Gammaproteobacteria bacterium]
MSAHSEFSLIQHYFEHLTSQRDDVLLGIGDDCALLQCPADHAIAVSIDTLVEGVHFFSDVEPESLGHKSLAVGLSDLAAMGATPAWFTLALSLPEANEKWLRGFSKGLANLATEYGIQLVGGDTTRGPLTISIQVHGIVKSGQALRRDGAQEGDLIYVSGCLGDAGAAVQLKLQQLDESSLQNEDKYYLQQRLERPTPRIALGQKLSGLATAAIDISDGLLADLGHIVEKSNVGARVELAQLPLSSALMKLDRTLAEQLALTSGDDYQLCFTVPPENVERLENLLGNQCHQIGVLTTGIAISCFNQQGELIEIKGTGYDHFPA